MAVEGADNLRQAFQELGDMNSREWKAILRASVQDSAKAVVAQARQNISSISPGKAESHKTYLGRLVSAGFAARNIAFKTKVYPRQGRAAAFIGVAKEAFYAISFFELGLPSLGIAKQPWLLPALKSKETTVVGTIGTGILKRINAIARKRAKVALEAGK